MTWDLIFLLNVWNCCPERYGKFLVVICVSFEDILGSRVGVGAVSVLQRGAGYSDLESKLQKKVRKTCTYRRALPKTSALREKR